MIKIEEHRNNCIVYAHIKSTRRRTEKGTSKAFMNIGKHLVKTSRKSMAEPKHGRLYRVYVGKNGRKLSRGRWHRASKVGESPAILTGNLSRSLGFNRRTFKELTFGSDAVSPKGFPYSKFHEERGRSFILRTIVKEEGVIENYFDDGIEREMMRGME